MRIRSFFFYLPRDFTRAMEDVWLVSNAHIPAITQCEAGGFNSHEPDGPGVKALPLTGAMWNRLRKPCCLREFGFRAWRL